jgi:zinc protease
MEKSSVLSSVRHVVLDNGLKVVYLKKTQAPVVAVQVWYKTGSVNERDGIRGISHFFEHRMFRGSKRVKSEEHARRINDVGGHCNAFTAEDVTAYLNSVPREYLDLALDLEADRMADLMLTQEVLDTERNVIVEEYQGHMNNPLAKAFLEFRKVFFRDYPYSIGPIGNIEDIRSVTLDDCQNYYRTWYTPENAVLVIVGDFDDDASLLARVQKTLGSVPASRPGPSPARPATPKPFTAGENVRMKRRVDFDVPFLILGYPSPPSSDNDALPIEILQMVMSQGETSRIHREIVRRQSLAVMAGGINQSLKWAGMSLFFAMFTPDVSVRRLERAMVAQIESMKKDGISEKELEKIKNATLTNRIFECYSAEQICNRLGHAETVEGDFRLWIKRLESLDRLDRDALVASAKKYWDDSRRHTLFLQPKKVNPVYFVVGLSRRLFGGK